MNIFSVFLPQIMKDWSELEDRYQDLHSTDAKGAEEFKHKMTNRYGIYIIVCKVL